MNQIYHHYTLWEDFRNGMYETTSNNEDTLILLAEKLLSNTAAFYKASLDMVKDWAVSSEVNLTNTGCNRQAWIGQAACSYKHNVPEYCTRIAWGNLTDAQRWSANEIADRVINIYENKITELHYPMGKPMLFKWDS